MSLKIDTKWNSKTCASRKEMLDTDIKRLSQFIFMINNHLKDKEFEEKGKKH